MNKKKEASKENYHVWVERGTPRWRGISTLAVVSYRVKSFTLHARNGIEGGEEIGRRVCMWLGI